jgi:uncharacterized membrane protein YukC
MYNVLNEFQKEQAKQNKEARLCSTMDWIQKWAVRGFASVLAIVLFIGLINELAS